MLIVLLTPGFAPLGAVCSDTPAFSLHPTPQQPYLRPCHIRTSVNSGENVCYEATCTAPQVGSIGVRRWDKILPVRDKGFYVALEGETVSFHQL